MPTALNLTHSVFHAFRSIDPEMPLSYGYLFVTVVQCVGEANEPVPFAVLEPKTGFTRAGFSRAIAALSNKRRGNLPGLGLVDRQTSPTDERSKQVVLTRRGVSLARTLKELEDAHQTPR